MIDFEVNTYIYSSKDGEKVFHNVKIPEYNIDFNISLDFDLETVFNSILDWLLEEIPVNIRMEEIIITTNQIANEIKKDRSDL